MNTTTVNRSDRDAVVDRIIRDLGSEGAIELLREPGGRQRLADYALIAGDLDLGGESRESYSVDRSLEALRRVLAGWCAVADGWLEARPVEADRRGETGAQRTANRDDRRLDQYTTFSAILDRLD